MRDKTRGERKKGRDERGERVEEREKKNATNRGNYEAVYRHVY